MLEQIPLALSSLKTAKDILKTIQDLRDFDKIFTATSELKESLIETYDSILASKEQLSAFQDRIFELEKENERLKDWSAEKEKYAPKPIASGFFAYMIKDFKGHPQNEYKLCCGCYDKNIKSPLQQSSEANGLVTKFVCSNGCPPVPFDSYVSVE